MLDTTQARNLIAAILVGLFWWPQAALGQVFPINPIRMIVPWPPGGGTDRLARVLAERMSDHLGQRVIIENISGAGGTTGSSRAAKAAPDGYTIIMGNIGTHSIAPAVYPKLDYVTVRDFKAIANFAYLTNYIVAGPSLKAADLSELIRMARKPGS